MTETFEHWQPLLVALRSWAAASDAFETGPGQITVQFTSPRGGDQTVDILMTPEEWEDIVDVKWGSFNHAMADVKDDILQVGERQQFLVYVDYGLAPSETRSLPEGPLMAKTRELARARPEGFGTWFAY